MDSLLLFFTYMFLVIGGRYSGMGKGTVKSNPSRDSGSSNRELKPPGMDITRSIVGVLGVSSWAMSNNYDTLNMFV